LRYFDAEKYLSDSSNHLLNNDCVPLRILLAELTTPICVYESKDDRYVSASIRKKGFWEAPEMRSVERILAKDPTVELLDIGCNIGCYTLMAAKLGHKVLAVDPFKQNLILLSRSLRQGNIAENVKGGYRFFQEVNVKYVFMEWMNHAENSETGRHIITFLRHFNMAPFTVGKSRKPLEYANNATWPGDVLWVKQTFK